MTSADTATARTWSPDLLGSPYEARTLAMPDDYEGAVVSTLVRRRAVGPSRGAVLYVHGFVDYFFQGDLGTFFAELGFDFYALDLRKAGRSQRPHQTPHFCISVEEYYADIDAAVSIITGEDEHRTLLLNGFAMGGLVCALWAHDRRDTEVVTALVLNSPFLDINKAPMVRGLAAGVTGLMGARKPFTVVPGGLDDLYGQSLHSDYNGEWDYDLGWKPIESVPVRLGWLKAVNDAHRRIRAGLRLAIPTLVLSSTESSRPRTWDDVLLRTDSVLDVGDILRWSTGLSTVLTIVRIDGAMHDVYLSATAVRARAYAETARWVAAYLPSPE